jgi:hypothetical protein
MPIRSAFKTAGALLCASLMAGTLTTTQAFAGESTGTWKYYPYGVHGGYAYRPGSNYGYRPAYGARPYYGRPAYARPYYGGGYGGGGYYGGPGYYGGSPYYERDNNAGAAVAAGVIGLAAGAMLGAAMSQQNRSVACTQYRTYDPRSGTYIGKGGRRYACR